MKPVYDFLKTTSKKGGISLSAEWLKENLGIEKGDTIISISVGGKVLLTRFNPDVAVDAKTLELLASGTSHKNTISQNIEKNDFEENIEIKHEVENEQEEKIEQEAEIANHPDTTEHEPA